MKRYLLVALLMMSASVHADFDKGVKCYEANDLKCAVKEFRASAEKGHVFSQNALAESYANGQGVRQDYAEAVKWYRLVAEQGYASAQFNMGVMYHEGKGVRQDKKNAKEWFGKACDGGFQKGCDYYRMLNEQGY